MRLGIKFRAQHEEDAQRVIDHVTKESNVENLMYVRQDDLWLLTTESYFGSLLLANDHIERARPVLEAHSGVDGREYVQRDRSEKFITLLQFAMQQVD